MTTPYVGEIRLLAFPRIPSGWFACDGSLKSINEYQLLFTLLGTSYGGDGVNTFAVPDLRGRLPVHQGTGPGLTARQIGQASGTEAVTITEAQMPQHTHTLNVTSTVATVSTPGSAVQLAAPANNDKMYTSSLTGLTQYAMSTLAVGNAGGTQAHDNTMPTLTGSFCIAYLGLFPSQQ